MGAVADEKPHGRQLQHTLRRRHSTIGFDPTALDRIIADADVVVDSSLNGSDAAEDTRDSSRLIVAILVILVVAGGTGTNVAFDLMNKVDPGCASLTSLFQYALTVAEGARLITKPRDIPLKWHACFVILMFCTAFLGNKSVEYNLPFSLYLIIKSSSLVANMVMGKLLLGKRYSTRQCAAVVVLTTGVVTATLSSKSTGQTDAHADSGGFDPVMLVGVCLCAASTAAMACLGNCQELVFQHYGKHYDEVLLYMHAAGLPLYLIDYRLLRTHLFYWCSTDAPTFEFFGCTLPTIWMLLLANVAACHICKHSFFALLGSTSSLTATLAITVYRFLGILLSALVFNSGPPPSGPFYCGLLLVVLGSFGYTFAANAVAAPQAGKIKEK